MRLKLLGFMVFVGVAGGTGCVSPNELVRQGTEGYGCYRDNTCDPGLACVLGLCRKRSTTVDSGGPSEAGSPDADGGAGEALLPDLSWPDLNCASPPASPVLDKYPSRTPLTQVVFKGVASGASSVTISGEGVSLTAKVASDRFCAEVKVAKKSAAQTFLLVAQDKGGCFSYPTVATIIYSASTSDINLLSGKVPTALKDSTATYTGNLAHLTDGKLDKKLTFRLADTSSKCDVYTWVWFDLGVDQTFHKVVVKYPLGTKRYLTCYDVLLSSKASPGKPPPYPYGPNWTLGVIKNSGNPDELTVTLPSGKQKGRHLALLMYENAESDDKYEDFEMTEIEAWGQPGLPSCQ